MKREKSFTNKKAKKSEGTAALTSLLALVALGSASTYVAYSASNIADLLIPSVRFQLPAVPSIFKNKFQVNHVATHSLPVPAVDSISVSVPDHVAYVPGVEFEALPSEPLALHGERVVFAQMAVRFNLIIGAQALDAEQLIASMNTAFDGSMVAQDNSVVQPAGGNQPAPTSVASLNTQNIASSAIVKNEMNTQRRVRRKSLNSILTVATNANATTKDVTTQIAMSEQSAVTVEPRAALGYSDLLSTLGVTKINTLDHVLVAQAKLPSTQAVNTQVASLQQPTRNTTTAAATIVNTQNQKVTTADVSTQNATIIENGIVLGARGPAAPVQPLAKPMEVNTQQAVASQAQDEVSTQPLVVTRPFGGIVTEAFSNGARPLQGARVQIIGSNLETYTDATGAFTFKNFQVQGVLPVMISKDQFFWRRVELKAGLTSKVELIAANAVNAAVLALGKTHQQETGFVFGQLYDPAGQSLAAYTVHLVGIENNGESESAHYVTAKGIPSAELAFSDERGQFILNNVRAGTYLLVVTDVFGQDRAPHVLRIGAGEGIIRKFSIGSKVMVSGQVLNATMQNAPLADATVQVLGATKNATTDKNGHFLVGPVYLDCDELNFVQIEKQGFYRNRLPYKCVASAEVENPLYVFSRSYIDSVAEESDVSLNSNEGLIMGHLSFNRPIKTQLLGPEEMNPSANTRGMDFYFDRDGLLNPNRETTSQNGNFSIINAPTGLSYLQAFDSDNNTLVIMPVLVGPSTINVSIQ